MSDLLKDDNLLSKTEMEAEFGIRVNFLEYNSIKIKMIPVLGLLRTRKKR